MDMEYFEVFKGNKPEEAVEFFSRKLRYTLGPMEVEFARKNKTPLEFTLIDVRAADDYKKGHVPGAMSLPEKEWPTLRSLSKEKLNIVYCYSLTCHLAARAALFFAEKGYRVTEMEGGFEEYKAHELDIETGETKAA
jgi:rhodanese-related sulfurtransferase